MQFQLPQFIETEDRIVGPFTMKQFIYLAATFGTAAILYFVLNPIVWLLVAAPLMVLGAGLGFIKINGQPFIKILSSAAKYYWQPQIYVWQPDEPHLPKPRPDHRTDTGSTLEKIVAGAALKSAWQEVQTGSRAGPADVAKRSFEQLRERYEVFHRITGERAAARRVDYR